ncbi:MAG TPA: glycosyltransferase [Sorangium sp.]|nr:glycosyltransferase [Sorangium sp.]
MTRPPRITVLGFTQPDDVIDRVTERSAVLPTQTHRFAWNLVDALASGGAEVSLLSSLPVPDHPQFPELVIRSKRFEARGLSGLSMGFVNALVLKHISRTLQCATRGRRFIREARPDAVVVHGVHTPFLRFARGLRRRGIRVIAVLTDAPGVVRPSDGPLARLLKRLDRRGVARVLADFDGVIALTAGLAEDFAPGVPALVFPGFAPVIEERTRAERTGDAFVVAYAGGLSPEYGVGSLVEAVAGSSSGALRLDVYGRGELEPWVIARSAEDSRIRYRGTLPPERLHPLLGAADVLVNPRRLTGEHVRYSFPSKLLEYAALGVPTVTTPLPAIPEGSREAFVIAAGDEPGDLRAAIERIQGWSAEERRDFARRARATVLAQSSPQRLGDDIVGFAVRGHPRQDIEEQRLD